MAGTQQITSCSQEVPALSCNCMLCLGISARAKGEGASPRVEMQDQTVYPGPANTSTHVAIITLGLFLGRGIGLSSFLSLFKEKPEEIQ